jgi:hypothetical protein
MLTVCILCNAHVRACSSACWEVVVGRRLSVSMIVCVALFGYPSAIAYPTLDGVVVEAFVELPSINQVEALCMGVSRMWRKVVSESSSIWIQSWVRGSGWGEVFDGSRVAGFSLQHHWKFRLGCKRKECKIWTQDGEMELRALWLIKSWILWDDQTSQVS